ncbi:transglutaminase-like cysteine peptidase, partial [Pseudomonas sp. BGM005]|nr:transglutaminase-like cysteine peptidase [Pseudomonas sp. BG5]
DGEGHAVLTLRTSEGDFVLDNLATDVKPWFATPYSFVKRQSSYTAGRWVTIENGRDVLVGALR